MPRTIDPPRLHYGGDQEDSEIREGDYVMDQDGEHFIVGDIDVNFGEVECLTQKGESVYRSPLNLFLLDRE